MGKPFLLALGSAILSLSIVLQFTSTEPVSGVQSYGDANCSGTVNPLDAALILQYSAGLLSMLPCADLADVNQDGQVNPLDSALVLQFSAGLLGDLGPSNPPTDTPTNAPIPTNTHTPTMVPPVATSTSVPTSTALPPTATTPATPTTPSAGAVTTRNSSWFVDGLLGSIEIVGEVVNGLANDISFVEVTANVYSASNILLTTDSTLACVTSIAAGADSPFDIFIFDPPTGVDHIETLVTGYDEAPFLFFDPPVVDLNPTITNVFTDSFDDRRVVGTVANKSSFTYDFINVCAAFYDGSGNVIRTGLDFVSPGTLGPGASATFEAEANIGGVTITSERVWVDASYTDSPTPLSDAVTVRNSSWFADELFGSIQIVGEVVNGLASDISFVEVTANAYSASNTLLTTSSTSTCVFSLAAGTDSPFRVFIFKPPPGVDHIELLVTEYDEEPFFFDPPVVGLDPAITNVFIDAFDDRHVVGTVTNNSSFTYNDIRVCAAFYDGSGNVVRTGFDYAVSPGTLGPGASATFEAEANVGGVTITSERVWVDASYD